MRPTRGRAAALAIAAAASLWLLAIGSAALVSPQSGRGAAGASAAVYLAGSLVCHQQPQRSFHYDGAQLPVCARCLGLYLGGALGAAAWAIRSAFHRGRTRWIDRLTSSTMPRLTLAYAALPTLVSLALGAAGLYDGSNAIRATLALPLGLAVGAVVTAVAAGDLR